MLLKSQETSTLYLLIPWKKVCTRTHARTHACTHTLVDGTSMNEECVAVDAVGSMPKLQPHAHTHTHTPMMVVSHPLSAFFIYYDPQHPLCSIYMPIDSLFPQSFSKFSLVYLLAWHPPFHTPYISSANHCLFFTAHACTVAACFAVLPRLCHLILVCLSRPFTWNSIL